MGNYLSPGVYIEEQDTGPEPIEGVSTSVTGFVGVTQSGPLDGKPPLLVTSFSEYQRIFGGYFMPGFSVPVTSQDTFNLMPHAVAGFFNNGGQLLYVKRAASVSSPPQTAAVSNLENFAGSPALTTRLVSSAVPGTLTLQLASLRGVQNGVMVTLTQVKNGVTSTSGALAVTSYSDAQKTVTLFAPLPAGTPAVSYYDWQYTTVALGNAPYKPAPNSSEFLLQAANPGQWGNSVQAQGNGLLVQITPSSRTQSQIVALGGGPPYSSIQLNSASNFYAGAVVEFNAGGSYQVAGNVSSGAFLAGEEVVQTRQVSTATLIGAVTGSGPMLVGPQTSPADAWDAWTGNSSNAVFTPTAAPAAVSFVDGSVTAGLFVAGEQVVQATTGAAAALIGTVTVTNPMRIGPQSGSAADGSHAWTGQTSGAIYTPADAPLQILSVIGSVSSGIFNAGEEVIQGTTGSKANLVGTVTGTSPMAIGPQTGAADATHTWTGSVSGAVYTPVGAPVETFAVTGTVSSGTFTANEEVIQNSVATAILIGTVPAAGPLSIGTISGDVPDATDVWKGETSGAVFTPSGVVPSALGKFYAKVATVTGSSIQLVSPLSAAQASTIQANLGAIPAVAVTVRTCEFDITNSYGRVNESLRGLTLDNTTPYYFATAIANSSSLLSVPTPLPYDNLTEDPSTMPVAPDGLNVLLTGGTDGGLPIASDISGVDSGPGNRTGIAALADAAEISIMATPGITNQVVQAAMITQCETLAYRFAILDPAPSASGGTPGIADIQSQRDLYDTHYAAIYYPRIVVSDPLSGNPLTISPSGHMAGIYAQTDASRGVWKAPANVVINGILSLETKLSKGDQDILNPEPSNINALRDFTAQGRGLRVYGARCITSETEWMYINVRRLFIFIEASLDQGSQWAVFEPNNQQLWNRLIQSVSAFLTTIWQQGGLMGATADQAFFVKCGYDTMSSDDIENGRLIMLVGIAPVFPAEFVIIRIGQWAGGSSVQEL
ncbi:MAG TPA: phage tail sheath C-terminal domain-containing protein [Acidobacteriaceae bacterium]|nr:phage tail sheath C-terminal domain-containing protein [Acidobacteriaceae bacterium]